MILIATGSEVSVALDARDLLQEDGIGTRVVSMPCMELFAAQDDAYRKRVLPGGPVRVGVEAAVRQGWDRWLLGERGREAKADFVGMSTLRLFRPGGDAVREVRDHSRGGRRAGEGSALTPLASEPRFRSRDPASCPCFQGTSARTSRRPYARA